MATPVNNKLVEENEGYGRTINQFLTLFIGPYFKEWGRVFNKQKFRIALIELFDEGRKPKIKIGKNVQVEVTFKHPKIKPEDVGKQIPIDLRDIKDITWPSTGLSEDSAKILVMRFNKDWWILDFDFRYNKGNAQKKLSRAREFLSSSKTIVRKKEYSPHVSIYLLWATAELIFDVKLMLHAQEVKGNKNAHGEKKKKLAGPLGEALVSPEFKNLFLNLHKRRNGARYGNKDFSKKYSIEYFRKQLRILEKEIDSINIKTR